MNIPKSAVDKFKTIIELKLYCYIQANHYEGMWHLTWIEKRELKEQYFIKANQIPRALASLVKEGILSKVKKGVYKLETLNQ